MYSLRMNFNISETALIILAQLTQNVNSLINYQNTIKVT